MGQIREECGVFGIFDPDGRASAQEVYYGLYALIHSNVICLGISVILAACVYFIVYLFVSKPGEEELGMMPGGRYMKKLARMMKII